MRQACERAQRGMVVESQRAGQTASWLRQGCDLAHDLLHHAGNAEALALTPLISARIQVTSNLLLDFGKDLNLEPGFYWYIICALKHAFSISYKACNLFFSLSILFFHHIPLRLYFTLNNMHSHTLPLSEPSAGGGARS